MWKTHHDKLTQGSTFYTTLTGTKLDGTRRKYHTTEDIRMRTQAPDYICYHSATDYIITTAQSSCSVSLV